MPHTMHRATRNIPYGRILSVSVFVVFLAIIGLITYTSNPASAARKEDWQSDNIIDDSVFIDANSMSVQDIQDFLDRTIGTCDIQGTGRATEYGSTLSRAAYAASRGWAAPPYTCLNKYYEVPKTNPGGALPANNYSNPSSIPAGAQSAAWIIKDAANRYNISPKVLLVKIATESAGPLTSDQWPLFSQYRYAMGARCPDSGPGGSANCNADYAGFSIQMYEAAALMRSYLNNMDQPWWPYKRVGNGNGAPDSSNPNWIGWNVAPRGCDGTVINIKTKATAALYTYTPYQPNQAALNNLYGTGDNCSAYGNRNFWRVFYDWFGSTTGPEYAWQLGSATLHYDAAMTQPVANTNGTYSLKSGQTAYAKVTANNTGRTAWPKASTRLGTQSPQDRRSPFANSSWQGANRTGGFSESGAVAPGSSATFTFPVTAPSSPNLYSEKFSVVIEGIAWSAPATTAYTISVSTPAEASKLNKHFSLAAGSTLTPGQNILSTEGHSVLHLSFGGSLELWTNYKKVWSSNTDGSGANRFVNQSDGNLVLYKNSTPVWSSNTFSPGLSGPLTLQSDGNLVLYKNNTPVWSSNTITFDQRYLTNSTLLTGQILFPGQSLSTPDRYYRLTAQTDGNIVLYTPTRAIWSSGTYMRKFNHIILQPDGNLVAYDGNKHPVWSSDTFMSNGNSLKVQQDGNTVLYSPERAVWTSNTFMVR